MMGLFTMGCAHTVDLRASHFAVPVVSDEDWTPQLHASFTSNTSITVLDDYTSNPPIEGPVQINQNDSDLTDVLLPGIKNIGMDASLSLKWGLEAFLHGSKLGLRWQFLNHGQGSHKFVAALHASSGNFIDGQSREGGGTKSEVDSTVISTQAGLSVGYAFDKAIPYISYINENHNITSEVKNNGGSFGPYKDSGRHIYYTLGLTAPLRDGFVYTVEVSGIDIQWNNPEVKGWQNSGGFRLGYSW